MHILNVVTVLHILMATSIDFYRFVAAAEKALCTGMQGVGMYQ